MTQRNRPHRSRSIQFTLVISIAAMSFAAIFVKWSDAPATMMAMYRLLLACLIMSPIIWFKRNEFRIISKRGWFFLFCSGVFLALHFALWFGSLKLTTVASSTIILALQPVVAMIGGYLIYKERTKRQALFTMLISIVGAIMIGWGDFGLGKEAIIGDLLSFLSVIAVVAYLLVGQNAVKKVSHWIYSFIVFMFAIVTLAIYNLLMNIPFTGYDSRDWGVFFLLATIPTFAHVAHNWLLKYVNATTISMSIIGEPVGASLLAWILLGEVLHIWQWAGGIVVLLGVYFFLVQIGKEQRHRKQRAPRG